MKLGAARHEAGRAAHLVEVTISQVGAATAKTDDTPKAATKSKARATPKPRAGRAKAGAAKKTEPAASLAFRLDRAKLRRVRRREGRYLLRTNLDAQQPERLWAFYIQLTEVEQAFKELKHDLAVRPIFHRKDKPRWIGGAG